MRTLEDMLHELRSRDWAVAVHNDYRLGGKDFTFWLFTRHTDRTYVKGEGCTDREAVEICLRQVCPQLFNA